jgi:hypothetical protein
LELIQALETEQSLFEAKSQISSLEKSSALYLQAIEQKDAGGLP